MPSCSTIAVVGASARAAVSSVLRSGWRAIAADLFADSDLARCCDVTRVEPYPEALADWLDTTDCDAWLYTGALENYPDLVDLMAAVRPLLGNAGEVLRRVRDPLLLQRLFRQHGLGFPDTIESINSVPLNGSWLAKTYRGSSGSSVWGVHCRAALDRARSSRAVLQRRVDGVPLAAVFVSDGRSAALLGVTRQLVGEAWTGAHEFQFCGSIGPWQIPEPARQSLAGMGDLLTSELHLSGLFGIDCVLDGRDLWAIEVNPRYTASVEIIEQAWDVRAIAAHVAACTAAGEVPSSMPLAATSEYVGKAVLFAKEPVYVTRNLTEWLLDRSEGKAFPHVADVPPPDTSIEVGSPLLSVFAKAETTEDVITGLQGQAAEVRSKITAVATASGS